ncbi:Cnl2/NKP2 family protein-domain-containing protein [Xylariaceae sp. FL1019]|nr:Cnl2/NKP2 family protein-domain-containing protein [Xylariaceae sp. FL1019]
MAPTEGTILRNYLLLPSRLPTIISLQEFTSLFPKSQQTSPQVRALYRDLQHQRNALVDAVSASIDTEVKQGKALRRTIIKTKREGALDEQDDEIEIERALSGSASTTLTPKRHSLLSIVPELDGAVAGVENEIQALEEEESALLDSIRQIAGDMSDLRYGRLSNSDVANEALDGLRGIQATCKQNHKRR